MKIGIIDVDGHGYPNLPLMKLSAWHKKQGDSVEWYNPMLSGHMDKVYMSKVFSFTKDYEYFIDADVIEKGGTGYAISVENGLETYCAAKDPKLPYEIEHIYPDYSLYPEQTKDTAYGFLTRGCPRGCEFCVVAPKEGKRSRKVADLSEFWNGQKNVVLFDPNITACPDCVELFQQLIKSGARVEFNQGIDIRTMTEEKALLLKQMRVSTIHFAWDKYEDGNIVLPKLEMFREITGWKRQKMIVYILTNFNTTFEQDLERVYRVRDLGYTPDVRIYEKQALPKGHQILKLQRWVNAHIIFAVPRFEDYKR